MNINYTMSNVTSSSSSQQNLRKFLKALAYDLLCLSITFTEMLLSLPLGNVYDNINDNVNDNDNHKVVVFMDIKLMILMRKI